MKQGIFEVQQLASATGRRYGTGWIVTYRTEVTDRGLRALGSLARNGRAVRECFDVAINDFGEFIVSAGPRSSQKIKFQHPMFEGA